MTKNESQQFQNNLRDFAGESYTVKVDKSLSQQERDELIAHIRGTVGDSDATVLIVEPVTAPKFDFSFDLVFPKSEELRPLQNKSNVEDRPRQVYGEKWMVMQNRMLNAISDLDLNERRLIMFLSPLVRKNVESHPEEKKRVFTVNALDFANEYDLGKKSIYRTLAEVADSMLHKAFFFWNFDNNERTHRTGVSWLVECEYKENEGHLEIILADTVIEMLSVFDRDNPFTKWQRHWIINLGSYGMILFELIASCMFQKYKQTTYTVEYLREKFNCIESYSEFYNFKRYVIDKAISDIHAHTPYRISYTQKKKGRAVNELVFSFEDSSESKVDNNQAKVLNNNADSYSIKGLSDPQLKRIVLNEEFIAVYNHMVSSTSAAGNNKKDWATEMVKRLKADASKFDKRPIRDYLDY